MTEPVITPGNKEPDKVIPPAEPSVIIGDDQDNEDRQEGGAAPSPDVAAEGEAGEIEREARAMGWRPQAEYRGKPEHWKDAKTWVDMGQRVVPIVRQENRTLREENRRLAERLARLEAAETAREQQRAELSAETRKLQLKQALEDNDHERAAQLQSEMVEAAVGKAKPPAPQITVDPEIDRIWREFVGDNPQFNDPRLAGRLKREMEGLREDGVTTIGREFLDEAADLVKRIYPDRFGRLPGRVSMAEGDGANGSARGNVRTWNDLKTEVREVLEEMERNVPGLSRQGMLANCAANPSQYFRR